VSEEIPPSALSVGPPDARAPTGSEAAYVLRVNKARWEAISPPGISPQLVRPAATVIGGWLLLAWTRFGFQGLSAPRVMTRFVLVGVYGWLGLAAILWLGALLLRPRDANPGHRHGDPERLLQVSGLAHQPLLAAGIALQITQVLPIPWAGTVIAFVAFLLWLPAMLAAATRAVLDQGLGPSIALTVAAYGAWLVTAGRFLLDRLGHLI